MKEEQKTNIKLVNYSPGKELFYTILGSLPMIVVNVICAYLIYVDYARNNYSFLEKSIYLSNVEKTSYDANVTCVDKEYASDRVNFPTCAPDYCFRYFNDFLITYEEADTILNIAKKTFAKTEPSGGISFFDIENGLGHLNSQEREVYKNIKEKIVKLIKSKFNVKTVYQSKPNYISKLTNKQPKTESDKYWKEKLDKNVFESVNFVSVVYLNDYMAEFNGGRMHFNNLQDNTILSIQPKKARLLVYSPGSENKNYDERLLYGERYALTIPFTCDLKFALKN